MTPEIMTTQALNDAVKTLLESQKEASRLFLETSSMFKETDKKFEDVAARFRETDKKFEADRKEAAARSKEIDKKFEDVAARFRETDKKFEADRKEAAARSKEIDKKFEEAAARSKEIDKQFEAVAAQSKKTDKRIKEAFDLFTNQWGRLMESLVEGDLIKLLRRRNIAVDHAATRIKGNRYGEDYEFDIIAVNATELVVTEVKTTLRPEDVRDFAVKLQKVKFYMPEYTAYRIYGAVAYLQDQSQAAKMAEKDGLFVIKATGSSASITNADNFQPKAW